MSRFIWYGRRRPIRGPAMACTFVLFALVAGTGCSPPKVRYAHNVIGCPGGVCVDITDVTVGDPSGGMVPVNVGGVNVDPDNQSGATNVKHRTTIWVDTDGDGNVDVDEDANGDGVLDPGEDLDGDGKLDTAEEVVQETSTPPPTSAPPPNTGPTTPGIPGAIHAPQQPAGKTVTIRIKVDLEFVDQVGGQQDGGFETEIKVTGR